MIPPMLITMLAGCIQHDRSARQSRSDSVGTPPHYFHGSMSRGCSPRMTQSRRKSMMRSLFMRSTTIVARPVAVRPLRLVPSALQTKCADHRCWRG